MNLEQLKAAHDALHTAPTKYESQLEAHAGIVQSFNAASAQREDSESALRGLRTRVQEAADALGDVIEALPTIPLPGSEG